jgi:tetratricopeptide (TPR) repeat protein
VSRGVQETAATARYDGEESMAEDAAPTRKEVEKQLARILASKVFATHPTSRALIARLVKDTLDGTVGGKDYEATLAREVFGKTREFRRLLDSVVRQGMVNLRKHRTAYFGADGFTDPVDIAFPTRTGFRAAFSYRRPPRAEATFQRLARVFAYTIPDFTRCKTLVAELDACVGEHPTYAPGYAILAEAILVCVACDDNWGTFRLPEALLKAEEAVKTGLALNHDLWHMHLVAGAVHCCRFAWDKADAAFTKALRLAPDETRAHFWYAAFLLAVGRTEEARDCVTGEADSARTGVAGYSTALFLYVTRDFTGAYNSLTDQWLVETGTTTRPQLGSITAFDEWTAEILAACICLALKNYASGDGYAFMGMKASKSSAFLGLWDFAIHMDLREKGEDGRGGLMDRVPYPSALSLALSYMGQGMSGEAIAELERACDDGHPLMVWLHLWPIFDPLHEHPRFKKLIRRMNLP